jgi:hypothetical protein
LASRNIGFTGTINKNRMMDFPLEKNIDKKNRGYLQTKYEQNAGVVATAWKDNKYIC